MNNYPLSSKPDLGVYHIAGNGFAVSNILTGIGSDVLYYDGAGTSLVLGVTGYRVVCVAYQISTGATISCFFKSGGSRVSLTHTMQKYGNHIAMIPQVYFVGRDDSSMEFLSDFACSVQMWWIYVPNAFFGF